MPEAAVIDYDMELVDLHNPDRKDSAECLAASPM